ncbi:MAG: hypothetical protein KAR42_07310 [candidate division Zixibacteria bacterium]|nr:hypothetical protein [candidate division Zixibacteria bacterium]
MTMIFVYIIFGFCFFTALVILLSETRVYASNYNQEFFVRLTVAGCGMAYSITRKQTTMIIGRYRKVFKKSESKPKAKKEKPKAVKREKKKERGQLSWSIKAKSIKAFLLFGSRVLSRLKYDIGQVAIRPAISNPALAGMSYGWGAAFLGAFPELGRKITYAPVFNGGDSTYEGELTLSIKNRQFCYPLYRLYQDLPIWIIIKQRYFK